MVRFTLRSAVLKICSHFRIPFGYYVKAFKPVNPVRGTPTRVYNKCEESTCTFTKNGHFTLILSHVNGRQKKAKIQNFKVLFFNNFDKDNPQENQVLWMSVLHTFRENDVWNFPSHIFACERKNKTKHHKNENFKILTNIKQGLEIYILSRRGTLAPNVTLIPLTIPRK